jgi:hypothetical protein
MKTSLFAILMFTVVVCAGCATSQIVDITSTPSKAAVSINNEYIGKSPCSFEMTDVDDYESIKILIEKRGFESDMKRINKKKSNGLYPSAVHFVLEQNASALREEVARSQSISNQMSTPQQMQGPTIVIPGMPVTSAVPSLPTPPFNPPPATISTEP